MICEYVMVCSLFTPLESLQSCTVYLTGTQCHNSILRYTKLLLKIHEGWMVLNKTLNCNCMQGCAIGEPRCHRQLTLTFRQLGKLAFFTLQCKCWAPRISWLGTFWLLAIFFRPNSCVFDSIWMDTHACKLITISQYLPLAKHSNVTLDVVPFIATWSVGPRIILGVEGIEPGSRTAK